MTTHGHQHGYHSHASTVTMKLVSDASNFAAGEKARLMFRPEDQHHPGHPVKLGVQHEAEFHLIIVNSQLNSFEHLHPEYDGNGNYFLDVVFQQSGSYILFADFQAEGFAPQTNKINVVVKGNVQQPAANAAQKLTDSTDGLSLTIEATAPFVAGAETMIPLSVTKDGTAIVAADITPYLGAVAHMILIGQQDKEFLHIHPMSDNKFPIIGHTVFPKADTYRMWVQFQTHGTLHTASFILEVKSAGEADMSHHHHGHHH